MDRKPKELAAQGSLTKQGSLRPNVRLRKLLLQEKRLLDACREGVIDLDELKAQKAKLSAQLKMVNTRQQTAKRPQEGSGTKEITFSDLQDLSAAYKRAMRKADKATKEKIANLIINRVKLFPNKAIVEGVIPIPDALNKPLD